MTGSVDLFWLPLGAGDRWVRWSGRAFEALAARHERRPAADLYHSALQVRLGADLFAIEMAPAWDAAAPDRGVVCAGPVAMSWLGRSRFFRYEVRRWHDGRIPDLAAAVGGPVCVQTSTDQVRRLLEIVPDFPAATWGRDELGTGEMWSSNSLCSWLLGGSGHEVDGLGPPARGRAPGWSAGLAVVRRRPPGRPAVPAQSADPRPEPETSPLDRSASALSARTKS